MVDLKTEDPSLGKPCVFVPLNLEKFYCKSKTNITRIGSLTYANKTYFYASS